MDKPTIFVAARWPTGHRLEIDLDPTDRRYRNDALDKSRRYALRKFVIVDPQGERYYLEYARDRGLYSEEMKWYLRMPFTAENRAIVLSALLEVLMIDPDGLDYGSLSAQLIQNLRLPYMVTSKKIEDWRDSEQDNLGPILQEMKKAWAKDRLQPMYSKRNQQGLRRDTSAARAEYVNTFMRWTDTIPLGKAISGTRARAHPAMFDVQRETRVVRSFKTNSNPTRYLSLRFSAETPQWSVLTAPDKEHHIHLGARGVTHEFIVQDVVSPLEALLEAEWILPMEEKEDWIEDQLDLVGEPELTVDVNVYSALNQPNPYLYKFDDFLLWAYAIMGIES